MALIGVLTHHWAKADKIEEAKKLLDGNGAAQSRTPGFGARHTFISLSDPTKISTLVTWGKQRDLRRLARQSGASSSHGRRRGIVVAAARIGAVRDAGLTAGIQP